MAQNVKLTVSAGSSDQKGVSTYGPFVLVLERRSGGGALLHIPGCSAAKCKREKSALAVILGIPARQAVVGNCLFGPLLTS